MRDEDASRRRLAGVGYQEGQERTRLPGPHAVMHSRDVARRWRLLGKR